MTEPQRGFATPPEVIGYFADKNLRPRFSWLDVWGQEHAHAFTVAKAVDAELLGAFERTIDGAIRDGKGFERWQEDAQAELQRLGWWGPRRVSDPQGLDPDKVVNFASRRRLDTIFWGNVSSARAAGQWERIQRTKAALPFILYVRTTSSDPRPEHLTWAGTILPADHPWWSTHFPPNGWHCDCSVRQISSRERSRLLEATKGPDGVYYVTDPVELGPPRTFVNRRTGERTQVPAGIDPGWQTNPGLSRARTLTTRLRETLEAAGPDVARQKIKELVESPTPRVLMGLPERVHLPIAVAPELARELGAKGQLIAIANDVIRTKARDHKIPLWDELAAAQLVVDQTAWKANSDGDPAVRVGSGEALGRLWRLAVRRSENGYLLVRTLHPWSERERLRALRKLEAAGRS